MSKSKHKGKGYYTEYGCIDYLRMCYRRLDTGLGHLHAASMASGMSDKAEALVDRLCDVMDDVARLIAETRAEGQSNQDTKQPGA
ncbi:MAG: hypothetical protein IJ943_01425 [Akkermansia sp.]|nr:hypothetical protein [Akkermansia sp.]MBR2407169.1 hypothetical protein [Clostridia bacterium]MBR3796911.1 hypothetical protein [Clostridia bacterium]